MVDLAAASLFQLLPISQAPDPTVVVKPSITVISENEFLILSWTGASTLGVFITGDGDPVRGTLEWPSHPQAVCACAVFLVPPDAGVSDDCVCVWFGSAGLSLRDDAAPQRDDRDSQHRDAEYRAGRACAAGSALAACGRQEGVDFLSEWVLHPVDAAVGEAAHGAAASGEEACCGRYEE